MGQCVLREWVVGGGGLDGHFGEQGLPAGIQDCLERFHRGCVDYLSWQFVPKRESPNGEGELATARTAYIDRYWLMYQNLTPLSAPPLASKTYETVTLYVAYFSLIKRISPSSCTFVCST